MSSEITMNRIDLSEGEVKTEECRKALPKPDPNEVPVIDRAKDPYMARLFGVNYDSRLVYVNIAPLALAFETVQLHSTFKATNPWFTPENQDVPEDDHKRARETLPISWEVFFDIHERLGVSRCSAPPEFEWNGVYDPRDPDIKAADDEMIQHLKEFAAKCPPSEDNRRKKRTPFVGSANKKYENGENGKGTHEDYDYNGNYDDGSSSDSANEYNPFEDPEGYLPWRKQRYIQYKDRPIRRPPIIPYGVHNPEPHAEEGFPAYFEGIIDKLTQEIRTELAKIDWMVDNPLKFTDRKTAGVWNVTIHDFHAERLKIWSKRALPEVFTSRPVSIAFNFGSTFDRYDPRLWVLEDDAPEPGAGAPFEFAQIGQNSLQYMLDIVRIHWNNLDPVDMYYLHDPVFTDSDSDSDNDDDSSASSSSSSSFRQRHLKTPIEHIFGRLLPPRRAVISLGLRIFALDLNILLQDLEPDFQELAEFAIFKYITSTPADDLQMRESLLVLWELTKIITLFTGEQPGRSHEVCTC
ncbi:hypothetical protein TWF481_011699 [Arthrobotrys musiformis]|uniref:Uncharacterized protein n=1 Tax=Arthrobotrys musiformis TaxID=47236 RepID=A0AAV9W170_9PEZI